MNEVVNGRSWVQCLAVCTLACVADTMLPVGDAIGSAAGAYQYS